MARLRTLKGYKKAKIGLDERTRLILDAEARRRPRSRSEIVRDIISEWYKPRERRGELPPLRFV